MGMFEGSDVDSTEQGEFEAQLKNKNPDSRMTIEQLENMVMKLRTEDSLRVRDQQYFEDNAVEFTEHQGDTAIDNHNNHCHKYSMSHSRQRTSLIM